MLLEKDEKTGVFEIKNLEITLKKSLWEKFSGVFWGLIKLFLVLAIIGLIFVGDEIAEENGKNDANIEKTYFDSYFRTEPENSDALKIGVVDISGVITSGEHPGMSADFTNDKQFIGLLVNTIEDEEVDAVLIRINSPGGEVLATEQITTVIDILREQSDKKIYVLLENMAASGGYYVATSGEKIFAYPETLLGNIGVRIDIPNVSGLMEKVGVEMNSVTSGEMKTMGSPFREMTAEEQEIFAELIDESYQKFVKRVSAGRNISEEDAKNLSDGRIFSGNQAIENGLVDSLISSFPALAMEISLDMNQGEKSVQFVQFTPKISAFEEFMMSVSGEISGVTSQFVPAKKTQFLMQ